MAKKQKGEVANDIKESINDNGQWCNQNGADVA